MFERESVSKVVFNTYRNRSDANQQWGFSPTGQIYSLSKPNLVLTNIEDRPVKDRTAEEKPLDRQEEATSGLENLEPSPAPSDKDEERPETGLAQLKDEFHGRRYSVVLLPKRPGDGTQR